MKYLNNKGYLLVEIIVASVLAMSIAYFMTDLVIKLKNKNDDLLVKTLASTDQAIIYNTLMKELYNNPDSFKCDSLIIDDGVFRYGDFTNVLSEYVTVGDDGVWDCKIITNKNNKNIVISIPLKVKQLPDDDFSVYIEYSY